jgi:hypothetical protein
MNLHTLLSLSLTPLRRPGIIPDDLEIRLQDALTIAVL